MPTPTDPTAGHSPLPWRWACLQPHYRHDARSVAGIWDHDTVEPLPAGMVGSYDTGSVYLTTAVYGTVVSYGQDRAHRAPVLEALSGGDGDAATLSISEADMALIVRAVNAEPALRACVEALRRIATIHRNDFLYSPGAMKEIASAALAALDAAEQAR